MSKKTKKILCAIAAAGVLATGSIGMSNAEKDDLRELIDTQIQDVSVYTPITYQMYSDSLNCAIAVSDDIFADKEEIDEAYSNLQNGLEQLEYVPDKSALQREYDNAVSIDQSVYIPKTIELLQHVIAHALAVLDDPNAVSDDVDAAFERLSSAVASLIARPDKTALITLCNNSEEIDKALYCPSSYHDLALALEHSYEIISDENAIEDDVNKAISLINQSIESLILKPDKTKLIELLNLANASDEETYTTVSYTSLQSVIASVSETIHDDDATAEQVSSAETKLNEALDGLVISNNGIYRISIRFSRESNDHVGNSWSYWATWNNDDIDGASITVRHGDSISIYCKVVEEDSIPDAGSGYLSLKMEDGAERSLSISVYENRGRYSGNRAVWIVTATATLLERV